MKFVIVTVTILCIIKPFFTKAELSIVAHDCEVAVIDKNHFKDIEIYILDNNRDNEFFVNFTIIKSLPITAVARMEMIGASLGEYVVPTGIDFSVGMCESIKEPIIGERIYKALGVKTDACPAPPGVYGNSKVTIIETSTMPNTFPPNKYKMIAEIREGAHIFCQLLTYFEIQ